MVATIYGNKDEICNVVRSYADIAKVHGLTSCLRLAHLPLLESALSPVR